MNSSNDLSNFIDSYSSFNLRSTPSPSNISPSSSSPINWQKRASITSTNFTLSPAPITLTNESMLCSAGAVQNDEEFKDLFDKQIKKKHRLRFSSRKKSNPNLITVNNKVKPNVATKPNNKFFAALSTILKKKQKLSPIIPGTPAAKPSSPILYSSTLFHDEDDEFEDKGTSISSQDTSDSYPETRSYSHIRSSSVPTWGYFDKQVERPKRYSSPSRLFRPHSFCSGKSSVPLMNDDTIFTSVTPTLTKQIPSTYYKNGVYILVSEGELGRGVRYGWFKYEFTQYKVVVKLVGSMIHGYGNYRACTFELEKRYSEFRKYYYLLKPKYPNDKFPNIPPKHLSKTTNFLPGTIKGRLDFFNEFLAFVALHDKMYNDPLTLAFFDVKDLLESSAITLLNPKKYKESQSAFFSRVTFLSITDKNLVEISNLACLTSLSTLHIYDNRIREFSFAESLKCLTRLAIQNNEIRELNALPVNLLVLDASHNKIQKVAFKIPLKLHTLNLDYQKVGVEQVIIDDDSFTGLTQLKTLSVVGNNLSNISSISKISTLETLHLDNNNISSWTELSSILNTIPLQTLSTTHNPIERSIKYRQRVVDTCIDYCIEMLNNKEVSGNEKECMRRMKAIKKKKKVKGKDLSKGDESEMTEMLVPHMPPFASQYRDFIGARAV